MGVTSVELAAKLLREIVRDDLYVAVLDRNDSKGAHADDPSAMKRCSPTPTAMAAKRVISVF
jgi:hypothetical protein